ncbi:MAG TPA: AMP-binding protein, partial [Pyrinomonadaceae bacterium]|nr:AMP-binding protein [Pyrinomonadaceae bacterium]
TWRLLIEAGWEGSDRLRILCGGEALPAELARELTKRGRQLWNLYGPTETTIWSTVDRIDSSEAKITLGRPIANTQVYLLDYNLEPVPVGVPGDLYIGGCGLAYGYHNRPDLTAERFIPDPFADVPGARLYNTGDLARYLPDGRIEYCERLDHQVKIRGFRIELGEIESVLRQHPAVADTAVTVRVDSKGEKSLVSYVTRRQQAELQLAESATEQISHWQMAWNQSYVQSPPFADPSFNIAGWNSSYTGLPIPEEEMREWTERTVERILALRPQRVLEIGCGTGLLLFRVAPHCTRYVATDISPEALRYVGSQLAQLQLGHVELLQRSADDLPGDEFQSFDTIILNSVIQYFPNINYLLRVIEKAKKLVSPPGQIFIGDVRSFPLLETFHASVQFHHAAASLPLAQLRQSIKTQADREEELTVDPAFFHALRANSSDISAVEVQLRRGRYHNELTRFRYDVALRVGAPGVSEREVEWLNWKQHNLSVRKLEELLAGDRPEVLGVSAVPNGRLASDLKLQGLLLSQRGELQIAGDLRQVSKEFPEDNTIDPEGLWGMGDELGYSVEINWSNYDGPGFFDTLFKRRDTAAEIRVTRPSPLSEQKSWSHYANDPLKGKLADKLARQLRQFLKERLPDYMVPSAFVVLESLPRTPNGKLDRRALPDPERVGTELRDSYVAPRTATEETLARIWCEVLGVDRIGVRDSFFDLGGHSLLATQVLMRVREAFQVEVPLRNLFGTPTVEGLAIAVLESEAAHTDDDELMQMLAELQL